MEEDIYCSLTIQCRVCCVNCPATEYAWNHVGAAYATCKACKGEVYRFALSVDALCLFTSSSSSSSSSNSDIDSDSGHRDAAETTEAPRPRRGVRRTQKLVDNSQTAKELAASKGPKGKGPTRRKLGKKAAAEAEMSQLLDGYQPPPRSAVLLEK